MEPSISTTVYLLMLVSVAVVVAAMNSQSWLSTKLSLFDFNVKTLATQPVATQPP